MKIKIKLNLTPWQALNYAKAKKLTEEVFEENLSDEGFIDYMVMTWKTNLINLLARRERKSSSLQAQKKLQQ